MKPSNPSEPSSLPSPGTDWVEIVRCHVSSLRFGVVQITVHGGRVVQVERTERFRFEGQTTPNAPDAP